MNDEINALTRLAQRISICHHSAVYWSFIFSVLSLADLTFLMFAAAYPLNIIESTLVLFLFMAMHILIVVILSSEPISLLMTRLLSINIEEVKFLGSKCKKNTRLSTVVTLVFLATIISTVLAAFITPTAPTLTLSLFTIIALSFLKFHVIETECLAISTLYAIPIALVFVLASIILKLSILVTVVSAELAYDIALITIITSLGVRECVNVKNW